MKINILSSSIKRDIIDNLKENKRLDNREFYQHRELEIETGVIEKANGSARVKLGDTEVIAGIKIESIRPYPDSPNEGLLMVNAEILPIAGQEYEPGPPQPNTIELSRVSDRGIRESGMVDFKSMVIKEGEHVYSVFADVAIINDAGNLFDATSYSITAALLTTNKPIIEQDGDGIKTLDESEKLKIATIPIATTFAKIDNSIIIDPTKNEEGIMNSRLTLVTNTDGTFVAAQKGNPGSFTIDEIKELTNISKEKGAVIRDIIKDRVEK